jgi:hypothetical protein
LLAALLLQTGVHAQTAAPVGAGSTQPAAPIEQASQRIRVEDSGAVISELRVGGQTRRIEVQPKDGLPAYQVAPATGERSWHVLGF